MAKKLHHTARCYSSRKFLHKSPCIIINPRPHREEIKSLNRARESKSFSFLLAIYHFLLFLSSPWSSSTIISGGAILRLESSFISLVVDPPFHGIEEWVSSSISYKTTLASINGKWPDYLLGEQVDHFTAIISYESPTVHPKQQQECSESDRVNYDTFGSCLSGF